MKWITNCLSAHVMYCIHPLQQDGFLAMTMVNYTALQGWSDGDHEVFDLDQFVEAFSLDGLNKATCRHNHDKLIWLNRQHLLLQYHQDPTTLINELQDHVIQHFPE